MIKKLMFYISLQFLILTSFTNAQETLDGFQSKTNQYYHTITGNGTTNFVFKLTSKSYVDYIKTFKVDTSFYYPLQVVWTDAGNRFYELQPFPESIPDSIKKKIVTHAQWLKNFYDLLSYDFQSYLNEVPLINLPDNANIWFSPDLDTVAVKYYIPSKGEQINLHKTFARSGQMGRSIWSVKESKSVSYPSYEEVNGKWVCVGWQSHTYKNNKITMGLVVDIEHTKMKEKYFPSRMNVSFQQNSKDDKIVSGSYQLFFKDYRTNLKIHVTQPEEETK